MNWEFHLISLIRSSFESKAEIEAIAELSQNILKNKNRKRNIRT